MLGSVSVIVYRQHWSRRELHSAWNLTADGTRTHQPVQGRPKRRSIPDSADLMRAELSASLKHRVPDGKAGHCRQHMWQYTSGMEVIESPPGV